MLAPALLSRLSAAFVLSFVAMGGSVAVQGNFLFRKELADALSPAPIVVRQYSLGNENKAALALFAIWPRFGLKNAPVTVAGIFDPTAAAPVVQPFQSRSSPWVAVTASRNGYGFLSTASGELYWFDMAALAHHLVYCGNDEFGNARLLACPDDGSIVVAAGPETTAWDRQTARMLWRRRDLRALSCVFVPRPQRLICGLDTGELVELDPLTGDCLRLIASYPDPIIHLGVSPNGDRLAVTNSYGFCVLTDLETGHAIWSRQFSAALGPQFSPDGKVILVPNREANIEVAIVSSASAEPLANLRGPGGYTLGLRVTEDGTGYAWNNQGTITAWNLATGKIMRQFTPQLIGSELSP